MNVMKASIQKLALFLCIRANLATMIWGDPGIGKTKSVEQMARVMGYYLETVIASIREPTDIGGHPVMSKAMPEYDRGAIVSFFFKTFEMKSSGLGEKDVEEALGSLIRIFGVPKSDGGSIKLAPPLWAKNIIDAAAQGKPGMVFLDELPTARPAVQVALLRVAIDKIVGDTPLPKDTVIVAAGNYPERTSGNWDLSSALANRFIHIDWQVDVDDWSNGVLYGWPDPVFPEIPENWKDGISDTQKMVVGFIRTRRELLHELPNAENKASRAWPSPRTWLDMLVPAYTIATSVAEPDPEVLNILCNGAVGEGAAPEFVTYAENLDLADPEEILRDPMQIALPTERDDLMYVTLGSVVHAIAGNLTVARWYTGWKVLKRAAEEGSEDVPIAHAYALGRLRPDGADEVPDELMHFSDVLQQAGVL